MNWYQEGDFHDTFQYPTIGSTAKIRFAVNSFSGHMVMHCHILTHEDRGMMAQYNLLGEEGTLWQGARDIDPFCILPHSSDDIAITATWRKDQ